MREEDNEILLKNCSSLEFKFLCENNGRGGGLHLLTVHPSAWLRETRGSQDLFFPPFILISFVVGNSDTALTLPQLCFEEIIIEQTLSRGGRGMRASVKKKC